MYVLKQATVCFASESLFDYDSLTGSCSTKQRDWWDCTEYGTRKRLAILSFTSLARLIFLPPYCPTFKSKRVPILVISPDNQVIILDVSKETFVESSGSFISAFIFAFSLSSRNSVLQLISYHSGSWIHTSSLGACLPCNFLCGHHYSLDCDLFTVHC